MRKFFHGSKANPIPVPSGDMNRYVPSEYEYIRRTVGPYRRTMQALLNVNGRSMDMITVMTPEGEEHIFYFDISGPMDRWKTIFQDAARKMGIPT